LRVVANLDANFFYLSQQKILWFSFYMLTTVISVVTEIKIK